MTNLDHLTKEELIDLLNAYDAYIVTAADAGLLKTGWVPVCISEFYNYEYQNVWRAGENFDYMYVGEESEVLLKEDSSFFYENAEIFFENGLYFCRFEGEAEKRLIRDDIRDIKDGDVFFVPSSFKLPIIRQALGDSHQNFDEKDEPWIVYDYADDSWFEEDIADPIACIKEILSSQRDKKTVKPSLESVIQTAEKSAVERSGSQTKPVSKER